jgi:hypothetical protein
VRVNAAMRRLAEPVESADRRVVPPELEDVLAYGWWVGPGGYLLLGPWEMPVHKRRQVPAEGIGEYEYDQNYFKMPGRDLAVAAEVFAPRLAGGGALSDDETIDYRGPDGEYSPAVLGFLRGMAQRGLTFAARALALADRQQLPGGAGMTAIVNTGVAGDVLVHGTFVRFTTARGVPSRSFDLAFFDDLESFTLDAMAVLTASDAVPFL